MKRKSYLLPYPEFRLYKELEQLETITEVENHIQEYINKTSKINNIVYTQELFDMCDRINKTLENQFNFYIPHIDMKIHYHLLIDNNDKIQLIRLCKCRINLMKLRLRYIMHCQSWINKRNNIKI